jgi:DNA uptake protein ComE-like DNA-binding protein
MKIDIEPVRNWFGYSRRERRASLILMIILLLVILVRYTIPDSNIKVEEVKTPDMQTKSSLTGSDSEEINTSTDSESSQASGRKSEKRYQKKSNETAGGRSGYLYSKTASSHKPGKEDGYGEQGTPMHVYYKKEGSDTGNVNVRKYVEILELNQCDSAALVSLPGIGPVLSGRIIRYRNLLGGFARVEQLKEVYGLNDETYNLIEAMVSADSSFISAINVNMCGFRELSRIRYLDRYEISSILKYRELRGKITSMTELTGNRIISAEKSVKIAPYIKF